MQLLQLPVMSDGQSEILMIESILCDQCFYPIIISYNSQTSLANKLQHGWQMKSNSYTECKYPHESILLCLLPLDQKHVAVPLGLSCF